MVAVPIYGPVHGAATRPELPEGETVRQLRGVLKARRAPLSHLGGTATRSLDGADPAELADPGHRGPVEEHLDRRLSVAFDKHPVRPIEPRWALPLGGLREQHDPSALAVPRRARMGRARGENPLQFSFTYKWSPHDAK